MSNAVDTVDQTEGTAEVAPYGGAAALPAISTEDAFMALSIPVLTHAIRYKWLYAALIAWVVVLVTIHPGAKHAANTASAAAFQQTTARRAAATAPAKATPTAPAASTASTGSTFSSGDSGFTSTDATSSDTSSSLYDSTPSGFTSGDTAPSDSGGDTSTTPSSDQPAPAAPTCTTDSTLPAPVVTTVVGAIGGVQTTVVGATGQQPPADPTATVGGAAGCTGGTSGTSAGPATAQSVSPVEQPADLFSPEAFEILLTRAMLAAI